MRFGLTITCSIALEILTFRIVSGQILVPERADNWRYSETQVDSRWSAVEFDDTGWHRGPAPLGFGEASLATSIRKVSSGEKVPMTTYFRTDFHVQSTDISPAFIQLKIRVDDGCCIFLNGQECQRYNLPQGALENTTPASEPLSAPQETLYQLFDISAEQLRAGRNVIAVEVHQCNAQSTDLYLDLRLTGHRPVTESVATSLQFNSLHKLDARTKVPDGFRDGGRNMQIDEFGNVSSDREILVVDRSIDVKLQQHLSYAASNELKQRSPLDRATRIARYIDQLMTPEQGRRFSEARCESLALQYASREVTLGDVVDLCGAGVCRHRSLLFKLMADEANLTCHLIRGNLGPAETTEGHTWNELVLENESMVIVDVMNPQPDFHFPAPGDRALRHYRTVANAMKYPTK